MFFGPLTTDGLFYYPSDRIYESPADYELAFDDVTFTSVNKQSAESIMLHGWWFPAKGIAQGTVIHAHGNAGNVTGHFQYVRWLPALGFNTFCFDYRGYGQSQGRPTREGTIYDTHAAIDCVMRRRDVDPARIALFGQSLGAAISIVVAAERDDLAGLVVEGAFARYRDAVEFVARQNWLLWPVAGLVSRAMFSDTHNPIESAPNLPAIPKLFICGTADTIVNHEDTVALHALSGDPKELWIIPDGRHTDALRVEPMRIRLFEFLCRCIGCAE